MERKRKLDVPEPGQPMAKKTVNPVTGRPYTNRYYEILEKRIGEAYFVQAVCGELRHLRCPFSQRCYMFLNQVGDMLSI
jgi:hypothetical protein